MWTSTLTAAEAAAVEALVARAAAIDGTAALNEDARLGRDDGSYRHLCHLEDGHLVGYLTYSTGHGTAQLVVDPTHRRRGIGRRLIEHLGDLAEPRLWAFGDGAPAQRFARSLSLAPGRQLLIMERELRPAVKLDGRARPQPGPRAGTIDQPRAERVDEPRAGRSPGQPDQEPPHAPVSLRAFRPSDSGQLLELNAAAFADHPEQGGLDLSGLRARMAEPWFDPAGLIEAFEGDTLLGFHWTKRPDAATGEVYVLAVHPQAQGRGLGRRLLDAGLQYLHDSGCRKAILYVDSADRVAVRLYESAGFAVAHRDVLYVPAPKEGRT